MCSCGTHQNKSSRSHRPREGQEAVSPHFPVRSSRGPERIKPVPFHAFNHYSSASSTGSPRSRTIIEMVSKHLAHVVLLLGLLCLANGRADAWHCAGIHIEVDLCTLTKTYIRDSTVSSQLTAPFYSDSNIVPGRCRVGLPLGMVFKV